jgi:hypothetical protein
MEAAAEITSLFDSNGYLIEQATLKGLRSTWKSLTVVRLIPAFSPQARRIAECQIMICTTKATS